VRSPRAHDLARLLAVRGARVEPDGDALEVTGLDCATVGELAGRHGIHLHELVLQEPSLEAAYMELPHDAVDYRAGVA